MFVITDNKGDLFVSTYDINLIASTHCETIVLLGNRKTKSDTHIKFSLDMEVLKKVKNGELKI